MEEYCGEHLNGVSLARFDVALKELYSNDRVAEILYSEQPYLAFSQQTISLLKY